MHRKIIHIDMDAFYAQVEQRDNPELRGKPVAIGVDGSRGVLSTASYEARKFGVHSAMSSIVAKRKCPELIFVYPNMEKYRSISIQIREIFSQYTDIIEPLSFDEAYLDVTENKKDNSSATLLAKDIKHEIFKETGLTASAGVSYNKFLAKTASDINKPNGIFVIKPEEAEPFLERLKIEKFYGIGKVSAQRFHKMGVFFGSDLRKLSLNRLNKEFGKAGAFYYNIVRGIDHRPVNAHRERKSVGGENTFSSDLRTVEEWIEKLEAICNKVYERLQRSQKLGKTITLKVKYSDFSQITRSKTINEFFISKELIWESTLELIEQTFEKGKGVRLLGISISNFLTEEQEFIQLEIEWPDE